MEEATFNPYAPPQTANPVAASGGDCYRQRKLLIVPRDSAPYVPCHSCVKCGQPATRVLPRIFYWHHPLLYILILPGLLFYVLVAIFVRKQMRITVGLCDQHRAVRRRWIWAAWLLFLLSLALLFQAFTTRGRSPGWLIMAWLGCFLLSLLVACIASNLILRPRRITEAEGQFTGAGEGYLQQFEGR